MIQESRTFSKYSINQVLAAIASPPPPPRSGLVSGPRYLITTNHHFFAPSVGKKTTVQLIIFFLSLLGRKWDLAVKSAHWFKISTSIKCKSELTHWSSSMIVTCSTRKIRTVIWFSHYYLLRDYFTMHTRSIFFLFLFFLAFLLFSFMRMCTQHVHVLSLYDCVISHTSTDKAIIPAYFASVLPTSLRQQLPSSVWPSLSIQVLPFLTRICIPGFDRSIILTGSAMLSKH